MRAGCPRSTSSWRSRWTSGPWSRGTSDSSPVSRGSEPRDERARLLLLLHRFRILPVIHAGRISRFAGIDLGVRRVMGAGLAPVVIDALGISRLRGLDLGIAGIWGLVRPGLVDRAVRVAPLRLVQRRLVRMLLLALGLLRLLLLRRSLRVRRLRGRRVGRVGFSARNRGSGDGQRETGGEREDQVRGHWAAPSESCGRVARRTFNG